MTLVELAVKMRGKIEAMAEELPDVVALETPELFPNWRWQDPGTPDKPVEWVAGVRLRHKGVLYRVLQTHTAQEGWSPDAAPSLFAKVLIADSSEIPEWEQPDSTNPYMKGDQVTNNGDAWESEIDYNVWEPGTYGWKKTSA